MVLRTDSESSDFADLELAGVEPLTLEDIVIGESYVNTQMVRYVDNTQKMDNQCEMKSIYRKNGVNNLLSRWLFVCLYILYFFSFSFKCFIIGYFWLQSVCLFFNLAFYCFSIYDLFTCLEVMRTMTRLPGEDSFLWLLT